VEGYFVGYPYGNLKAGVSPEIQRLVRNGVADCASLYWGKIEEILQLQGNGADPKEIEREIVALRQECNNLAWSCIEPFLNRHLPAFACVA